MSRRAQQHIVAERRMLRSQQEREDTQFSAARVLDAYVKAHEDLYGTTPAITYNKGWFNIGRGKRIDAYRATEIVRMTGTLMARLHQKQMTEQIDHPELLTEGE